MVTIKKQGNKNQLVIKSIFYSTQHFWIRNEQRNGNRKLVYWKMIVFKSGIIFLFVLMKQSTQISISNGKNSETSSSSTNQTTCFETIGHCFLYKPNTMAICAIQHTLNSIDCFMDSNATWHFNKYITMKKNPNWKRIEYDVRNHPSVFGTIFNKLTNLFTSRSIEFSIPESNLMEDGRQKFGLSDLNAFTDFGGSGNKKSEYKFSYFCLFFSWTFLES